MNLLVNCFKWQNLRNDNAKNFLIAAYYDKVLYHTRQVFCTISRIDLKKTFRLCIHCVTFHSNKYRYHLWLIYQICDNGCQFYLLKNSNAPIINSIGFILYSLKIEQRKENRLRPTSICTNEIFFLLNNVAK